MLPTWRKYVLSQRVKKYLEEHRAKIWVRIKASNEPGARGLGPRKKRKCKRCGQVGHIGRLCKEPVPMSECEDEQVPIIASSTSSRKGGKKSGTKRKRGKTDPRNKISASNLAEAIASTSLTAAATSVSMPHQIRTSRTPPDSPACNTRSKKQRPACNTRSKKQLDV